MPNDQGVVGVFGYVDDLLNGLRRLKEGNFEIRSVYSPLRLRAIQEVLGTKPSIVRWITLIGGILGGTSLVGLAIFAHSRFELITSGKPVYPAVPWVIVLFEGTVLLAAIFSVIAWIVVGGLPRVRYRRGQSAGYDPRFSEDRFGILVGCTGLDRAEIMRILRDSGAEEVRDVAG
jgi:Protein of unknown function (DUF3341)